jgi:2-polyprenyl-3-methyl-5-hydroxy-6-metoxy-1,4-benzoquinol methylase
VSDAADLVEAIWEQVPPDAVPERFAARCAWLLGRVPANARVLDAGCGAGEFAEALAAVGNDVVGVDLAAEAVRRARARGVDARRWDPGAPLPADDAAFDLVWVGEVLEHVVDLAPWLSEVRRTLRPGGTLLLSTPHHGPGVLLALALSRRRFAEHFEPRSDHVRFLSPATLRALLEDLGFDVVTLQPSFGAPGFRATILGEAVRR